jgi:hypothetical protein
MALAIPAEAPVTIMTSLDTDILDLKFSKILKKQKSKAGCNIFIFFALRFILKWKSEINP